MRKAWQNHLSASKGLAEHPKRVQRGGPWRPGKKTPNLKKRLGKAMKGKKR